MKWQISTQVILRRGGGGGGGGYEQELLYFESHQAIKWRFAGGPMLARL